MGLVHSLGDLVVVRPTPGEEIRVGEILASQLRSGEPDLLTHRVISRTVSINGAITFLPQNDANGTVDEQPVREDQVMGAVWYTIPWPGWVSQIIMGIWLVR